MTGLPVIAGCLALFTGMPLAITDSELKAILRAGAGALAAEGFAGAIFCAGSFFCGGVFFFDAGLRLAAAFLAAGLLLMAAFFRAVFFLAAFAAVFFLPAGLRAGAFFTGVFFLAALRAAFFGVVLRALTRGLEDLAGRLAGLLVLDRFFMWMLGVG